MRIVSLLPSATDIVIALGAADNLVGVSHSCSGYPKPLPVLTSTWVDVEAPSAVIDEQVSTADKPLYELDVAALAALAPDVVISQSLCDVCAVPSGDVLEAVQSLPGAPCLVDLTPNRLRDVPDCFLQVGAAIEADEQAEELVCQWHAEFARYHRRFADTGLSVAFLDWLDPPFAAGHWMPDMLQWLGVESAFGRSGAPSYAITWEDLHETGPHMIVAACCGFDESRTVMEADAAGLSVVCLDGATHFNRPSPALLPSLKLLAETIERFLSDG